MELVVARNPDPDSSLPYPVRLPLGREGLALKVRDTWPRTTKVFCHRADEWPRSGLEVLVRVPVRSCVRRGAAIDLVLARTRGREMIFWQSARTAKQARPNVSVPTSRASGRVLEIVVDSHERYPWTFRRQQATTQRAALAAGD